MTFLKRLEVRLGRYAAPHLTIALIAGQVLLYVLALMPQGINLERITLIPTKVLDGEVWRLLTFLFIPPMGTPPIFALFYFMLFHLFGTGVEQYLGRTRYNLYFLVGYLANVGAAFLGAILLGGRGGDGALTLAPIEASNQFLYLTVFLAFARIYPDFIINLFFVLPVKIRWLGWLTWAGMIYGAYRGGWVAALLLIASTANYLLFFGPGHLRQARAKQRRVRFQAKATAAQKAPRHECRVCGLDSDESPRTLFRYCSKCAGQACYCPTHIREHEHLVETKNEA